MSTLTLAVADYFKQEPQQAAPEIKHKVGPVGIPNHHQRQSCHSLILTPPRDLLLSSAPPTLVKMPPRVIHSIDSSYTSLSRLAPDLTAWDPLAIDPLATEPAGVASPVIPMAQVAPKAPETANAPETPKGTKTPEETPQVLVSEFFKQPLQETVSRDSQALPDTGSPLDKPRSASDTTPPLRKLKSSLKLPQLHKCNSTSLLSPKLVRFASHLEKVKTFDGRDSPLAVSAQNTPLGSPSHRDFDVEDYFSNNSNFTDLSLGSDDSDLDLDSFFGSVPQHNYKISFTNFTPPQNIYDKLSSPVYLQSASVSLDKKLMVLFVMCENLAFEKNLSIKITFNDWHSTVIYNNAQYVKLFSLLNFDQFKFVIPLTSLPSAINTQFCIKYCVAGHTFWDNNSTKNYSVTLTSSGKPRPKPRKAKINSSFDFLDNVNSMGDSFAPAKSTIPYTELVSKLKNVKKDEQKRVPLFKSFSASNVNSPPARLATSATLARPKYSQSYKLRTAGSPPAQEASPASKTSAVPVRGLGASELSGDSTPRSVGEFHDTQFNSNTYAALLRTYCFSGTPSVSSPVSTPTNAHTTTDPGFACASPASTFHSLSDSIHT